MSARDRLLLTTIDLVQRHGVAGTGIAAIIERGRVARRSIYLNFPDGKSELVQEATRLAGSFIDHRIEAALQLPTPHAALRAFVDEWEGVVSNSDFAAGCPIAAAGLARSAEPAIADVAGDTFTRWQSMIGSSLNEHGIDGDTAHALANTVLAAVEGAVIMCLAQKSLAPLDDVHDQLAVLLTHHLSGTSDTPTRRRS